MNRLYIAIVAVLMLITAAAWGGWTANGWRIDRQIQQGKAEQAASDLYAEKENRTRERLRAQGVTNAIADANARAADHRRAADRAGTELVGLRDALAAAQLQRDLPGQSSPATGDHSAAIATVLSECGAELQALARAADGHANDALTLRMAWPK